MREGEYQAGLIVRLRALIPGVVILKNDPGYQQGMLDLLLLYKKKWAMLEVKAYENAAQQPNQDYWVRELNKMSFAAFIFPENEEEIIHALQQTFGSAKPARVSKSQ